jgi:hypothetical protein
VNTFGWIVTLIVTLLAYRSARVRLLAMGAKLAPLAPQVAGHDEQIGNLTRTVELLVPPDAQPTTAHRAALPAAPVGEQLARALSARSPASAAPTGPRVRADIRPTRFPSDVAVLLSYGDKAKVLNLDARDVNLREGTVPVTVLDASRPDVVLVELPPERQRGRVVSLPRGLVLDCPESAPPSATPAAVGVEGDRGGIILGDPIPQERVEVFRAPLKAEADARSRPQLPSAQAEEDDDDGATPEEETRVYTGKSRKRPTLLGGLAGAPQGDARSSDTPQGDARSSDTLVSAGVKLPEDPDDGSVVVEPQHWDGRPLSDRRDPGPDSDPDSDEL